MLYHRAKKKSVNYENETMKLKPLEEENRSYVYTKSEEQWNM